MLRALSKSFLTSGSKLPKLRCVGINWTTNLSPVTRYYSANRPLPSPGKEVSAKAKRRQTSDGVPLSYGVIYNSHDYHTITHHACTVLTGGFWILGGIHVIKDYEELFPDFWSSALNLWLATIYLYVNIGTLFFTYTSPVRIYFDEASGDYRAIFNHWIPTKIRTLDFRKGDVEHLPPADELSLFRYSRFKIKDQKLYMLEQFFRYPADLYNMFDEIEEEDEQAESAK